MSNRAVALAIRPDTTEMPFSKITENVNGEMLRTVEVEYPELGKAHSSYHWFSKRNFEDARNYYLALGIANQQGRLDQVSLFAGAIVDLYQRDRAERTSVHIGGGVRPKREEELPPFIMRGRHEYRLQLTQVQSFDHKIPHHILAAVSELYLSTQDAPDDLFLASYVSSYTPLPDPWLYAKYGRWLVQVAEWE